MAKDMVRVRVGETVIYTSRIVEARQLRLAAAQIDEDYADLLCTYNRIWDASDGRDPRLPWIEGDLEYMRRQWRAKLDQAAKLLGERREKR